MTGKGNLTHMPTRRMRLLVGAHLFWLALVCLLGAWWGRLVLKQGARIAELESAGGSAAAAGEQWLRTQRMVYWESSTYYALLLVSTVLLFWLYWRDTQRARGLQAFFASVTHELRTPLTSIRLQAESIADTQGQEQNELIRRLLEDTMRLEGQVERTLELARVEGGGPVLRQPIELKPWLERTMEHWKSAYAGQAELKLEIDDVTIEADPAAIQVILKNLIENSVRHARNRKVKITVRTTDRCTLEIRDDGAGFTGKVSELGELFHKGPYSQGAGVGLYLVRILMSRMGGRAEFLTEGPGFGVRLHFNG